MKIVIRESTMVTPAEETPMTKLWLSNLDLIAPKSHTTAVYFYRPNDAEKFFDIKVMKDFLSRALVAFYPMSGRLNEDQSGRIVLDCRGQGVLFVEAECDLTIDDFGDFSPRMELQKLIPDYDYTLPNESIPLLILQVTYLKCGGVCLGLGVHHYAADGPSSMDFMKVWSEMARGLDLTVPPFTDRTLLRAQDPPQAVFEHVEFQPPPIMKLPSLEAQSHETVASIFKFSRDQINALKLKSKEAESTINYTSFELLTSHVWKCVCEARGLPDDQKTKLYIATDGRARFEPNLPTGYFGNVILLTTPIAAIREIKSNPSWRLVSKIRDVIKIRNDDYLKSTIDFLEVQPDLKALDAGVLQGYHCSSLEITSWAKLPIYDADFGWGRTIYMGPSGPLVKGWGIVLQSPINDGSLSIAIQLQVEHMKLFSSLLYDI